MTAWLPRRRISVKPWAAGMRQAASPDSTRSLPNRDLNLGHKYVRPQSRRDFRRRCRFEEEFDGFRQISAGLLHGFTLASDIKFRAKRAVAVAFALDDRRQTTFLFHRSPLRILEQSTLLALVRN